MTNYVPEPGRERFVADLASAMNVAEHLHVIVAGEVEYTLGPFPPRAMRAGEAVLVPAGIPSGIRNVPDAPACYLAFADITSGADEKVQLERPQP